MAALLLQNRILPWSTTSRVVYAWPLDKPESFCLVLDEAFTDSAHRVIVAGTDRCALHAMYEAPCIRGARTPPECQHERLDPQADPAHPRCLTCGAVGADVSARYLRTTERVRALVPDAETYSEVAVGDA